MPLSRLNLVKNVAIDNGELRTSDTTDYFKQTCFKSNFVYGAVSIECVTITSKLLTNSQLF